jgi:hypothetical protein
MGDTEKKKKKKKKKKKNVSVRSNLTCEINIDTII